jgi:hypothetical protein
MTRQKPQALTPAQEWAIHWPFRRASPELIRKVQQAQKAARTSPPAGMPPAPF